MFFVTGATGNAGGAVARALAGARGIFLLSGYERMDSCSRTLAAGTWSGSCCCRAALGRELRLEARSKRLAREEMSATMPAEYVAFFSFFVDGAVDETTVLPTVLEVLGREPRSFDQWVAANVEAFGEEADATMTASEQATSASPRQWRPTLGETDNV